MFKGVKYRLIAALAFFALFTGAGVYAFLTESVFLAVLSGLMTLVMIIVIVKIYQYNSRKITFMFDSIENDDFMFRFQEDVAFTQDKLVNRSLNRIKDILMLAKRDVAEKERYYELILARVITGVVVINEKGNVFQTNQEALKLLDLPVFTHVNQLAKINEDFPRIFLALKPGDSEQITFANERGTVNLSLQASDVVIRGKQLKIVAVNDIGRELDEKEVESWIRLTRVLTHEIMNAITPITSLSDTLLTMHGDRADDLTNGLEAINSTGKSLMSFVDSYRSFTRIPQPEKENIPLKKFLERAVVLAAEYIEDSRITVEMKVTPEDMALYADENQILQVVLNILKNGVAAISERGAGTICIDAYHEAGNNIIIEVTNTGVPIPHEEFDHIFVPFFTTRENGSGVGLSVSRQIMRLHNGNIKLKSSTEEKTTFTLTFRH